MRLTLTAADARQQNIGTGIVAELDGGLAHVRHRHRSAFFQVLLGYRSILQQVTRAIRD
jgi:hypothetical protein